MHDGMTKLLVVSSIYLRVAVWMAGYPSVPSKRPSAERKMKEKHC